MTTALASCNPRPRYYNVITYSRYIVASNLYHVKFSVDDSVLAFTLTMDIYIIDN